MFKIILSKNLAKKFLSGFVVAAFLVTGAGMALPGPQDTHAAERVDVLIGFGNTPGQSEQALVRAFGGEISHSFHLVPAIAASVPSSALNGLRNHPLVTVVELDGTVQAIDAELDNTWGVKRIGAGDAHADGEKGTGVKAAVIDSGIDYNHEDLDANFAGGYDFVNDDTDPMDDNGHGTHVSGTVAAEDNDTGVVGAAPEAALYGLKVLNENGSGSWSDVIAALEWAVDNGLQVTNNSYGSGKDPGSTVQAAFDNSAAAGVLHIAAAGNSGNPPGKGDKVGYPARYDSVVAVAATDKDDERASFSSTGPDVELAAPGVDIPSTLLGGGYGEKSGTSMASPHAAGTAALVIAAGISDADGDGNINDDVRQVLQDTADDLGEAGRDEKYGYGLVNAYGAVLAVGPVTDIAVTAVDAPSSVVVGDTTSVDVTVENVGNQDVSSDIDVALEDETDVVTIGTQTITGGLVAGESVTLTYSWDTTDSSLGDHTLTGSHNFSDDDSTNDAKSTVVTVEEETTDIAITAVDAPGTVTQGDVVDVDVTVENVGNQDVSSDIDVTLVDETDGVTIGTRTISGGLAAGESVVLTYSWDTSNASEGDHTLTASHNFSDDDSTNDAKSTVVTVSTGDSSEMGVFDIRWSAKKHLEFTPNIRQDSDGDGTLGSGDDPVDGADVAATLTYDSDGDGVFECGGDDDCWNFSATTNNDGDVKFKLLFAPSGDYKAEVTDLTHSSLTWDSALDEDNPDFFTK